MAETIGLIASVIQVAGAGLKLSQTLYQYADGVATADRRVKDIAKEIQLTSFVIEELGTLFKRDGTSALLSKNALETADETVKECSSVFTDLDSALKKSKKNALGRLMLPFREKKIELLRSHIDKLKSTLQLLMQVLTHAHQVAAQKLDREAESVQREHIKALLLNNKESTKRYEESLKNYSMSDESTIVNDDDSGMNIAKITTNNSVLMSTASIGSSVTVKTLETCVQHIQDLLADLETLQGALEKQGEGNDHSKHHQSLVGSYFRARAHLDSVLLGNPNSAAGLSKATTNTNTTEPSAGYARRPRENGSWSSVGVTLPQATSTVFRERERERDWETSSYGSRSYTTVKRYKVPDQSLEEDTYESEVRVVHRGREPIQERREVREYVVNREEPARDREVRDDRYVEREVVRSPSPRREIREYRIERRVERSPSPPAVREYHMERPYGLESYSRSTEFFRPQHPPQPIIIRNEAPQPIIVRREEPSYEVIERSKVVDDRQVARHREDYHNESHFSHESEDQQGNVAEVAVNAKPILTPDQMGEESNRAARPHPKKKAKRKMAMVVDAREKGALDKARSEEQLQRADEYEKKTESAERDGTKEAVQIDIYESIRGSTSSASRTPQEETITQKGTEEVEEEEEAAAHEVPYMDAEPLPISPSYKSDTRHVATTNLPERQPITDEMVLLGYKSSHGEWPPISFLKDPACPRDCYGSLGLLELSQRKRLIEDRRKQGEDDSEHIAAWRAMTAEMQALLKAEQSTNNGEELIPPLDLGPSNFNAAYGVDSDELGRESVPMSIFSAPSDGPPLPPPVDSYAGIHIADSGSGTFVGVGPWAYGVGTGNNPFAREPQLQSGTNAQAQNKSALDDLFGNDEVSGPTQAWPTPPTRDELLEAKDSGPSRSPKRPERMRSSTTSPRDDTVEIIRIRSNSPVPESSNDADVNFSSALRAIESEYGLEIAFGSPAASMPIKNTSKQEDKGKDEIDREVDDLLRDWTTIAG